MGGQLILIFPGCQPSHREPERIPSIRTENRLRNFSRKSFIKKGGFDEWCPTLRTTGCFFLLKQAAASSKAKVSWEKSAQGNRQISPVSLVEGVPPAPAQQEEGGRSDSWDPTV